MTEHGHAPRSGKTPTFNSWRAMCERCTNPNSTRYRWYGARGISVCDRWRGRGGFANFLADVGERPEGKTLDRIDTNGNYEPGNCRWATHAEQIANKRPNPGTIKMTEADVFAIRIAALTTSLSQGQIGEMFGVRQTHVGKILRNEIWRRPWLHGKP